MVVIQVLGISNASTEEQLQAITKDLLDLCRRKRDDDSYIAFSSDRMQMDLGAEIVALVYLSLNGSPLGEEVGRILEKHFPDGTLVGVQVIEARTVRELTKREESTCRS